MYCHECQCVEGNDVASDSLDNSARIFTLSNNGLVGDNFIQSALFQLMAWLETVYTNVVSSHQGQFLFVRHVFELLALICRMLLHLAS